MPDKCVTSINITYNVAFITLENLPIDYKLISDIFNSIAKLKINIDMISQAPPFRGSISLSFSLPSEDVISALGALNKFKKDISSLQIEIDADNTKLQVYGERMRDIPGVAAKLFTVLADEGIEIKLVTTSEIDISYLIYEKDVDKAIAAIKKEFGL